MALPTSGLLSLNDIIAEFGGGTSLTDFYRGGARVSNTPANSGVPISGQISIRDFLGASNLISFTVSCSPDPASRFASGRGASRTVTSPQVTAAPSAGSGHSFAWSRVNGDAMTITSPTSNQTTFSNTVSDGVPQQGVYRCTVTGSDGYVAHGDVTVNLVYSQI